MTLQKNLSFFSLLALLMVAVSPAASANDDSWWFGFGNAFNQTPQGSLGNWNQSFDRSAAREWEKNPPKGYPTLDEGNIPMMKEAVTRYASIVSSGGWRKIPAGKLEPGMRSEKVAFLRRRLELTGDLQRSSDYSTYYDSYVERAVKHFQVRHGLTPKGVVDRRTLAALNVSANIRLRQLRTNIARLYGLSRKAADRYVAVNIPAQQIEAVEGDRIVSRHAAVVGKIDRQSPRLRSKIHEINFNPYWNVPRSIVRKDIVPKAQAEVKRGRYDMLERYRISALDSQGRKVDSRKIDWFSNEPYNYRYRQDPWKDNSMGFVKINFHNQHAVYMHDTPSKSLFGRNMRANSSGCIRVQNVKQLVTWLLRSNGDWNRSRVDHMQSGGERLDVKVKKPVPVYFIYVTSWATKDGTVHFRRDLYNLDGVGATASAY